MTSKPSSYLTAFREFIKDMRITSKEVTSLTEAGTQLKLWEGQRRVLDFIGKGLDEGAHDFRCLKSRQLGITTVTLGIDIFWAALHPGMLGCLVTEHEGNAEKNRALIEAYVKSFPDGYFGDDFYVLKNNRKFIEFSNSARLNILVAGVKKKNSTAWAEGSGYTYAHLCMARDTPVICEHGIIKPIQDVKKGEWVITHTGANAKVIDVCGQPNTKGSMIKVSPWLGDPIYFTDEHTIPTNRGIVEAKDLTHNHLLVMPVRPIRHDLSAVYLPETKSATAPHIKRNDGWIRVLGAASGARFEFNEETGFAIGYYLAEGCLIMNRGIPSGITFTRHRSEAAYADRATAALLPYTTGHRKTVDRLGTLTTIDTVYGTPLCRWIETIFGRAGDKRIPDDVFDWGPDFCRGLLAGLLSGDGSKSVTTSPRVKRENRGMRRRTPTTSVKSYDVNTIVLPTTRSSLATQARDLASSLGFGWGGIKFYPGGNRYGRNCKPSWRVFWNGEAAAGLRPLMALEAVKRNGHNFSSKAVIQDGSVYIKIRSIEHGCEQPEMWDISVDHPDHTFRTPSMSVGNTEVASYADADGLESLEESFAQTNPDRLFIYESTAKGMTGPWRARYLEGLQDRFTKRSIFIGWWAGDTNRIERGDPRFAAYGRQPMTGDEREKVQAVKTLYDWQITPEQLCWYRWKEANPSKDSDMLGQNQPFTDMDAFVQTGHSFFASRSVGQAMQNMDEAIKEADDTGEVCEFHFRGYRYEFGSEDGQPRGKHPFFDMTMVPEEEDLDRVELRIWEEPKPTGRYVIGVDPAWGRTEHGDNHCASVWRCFSDRLVQVAEFNTKDIEIKQFAWVLCHLAGAYQDSIINVELNGPGRLIMPEWDTIRALLQADQYKDQLKHADWENALGQARWYLYHRPDAMGAGYAYNTEGTTRTQQVMMHTLRGEFVTRHLAIRSMLLLKEMLNVIVDGAHIGAPDSDSDDCKDDRVYSAGLAVGAWVEWRRAEMLALNISYQITMEEERGEQTPIARTLNSIVSNFFLRAAERESMPFDPRPRWKADRGLA
jgi:hypothetical protein